MKPLHQDVLTRFPAENIIQLLEKYLSERRLQRIHSVLNSRLQSIDLAIEAPYNIRNALATIRSAEALGINTVHIINPGDEIIGAHGTTQGAIYWINVIYHNHLTEFLSYCQQHHIELYGGVTDTAITINHIPVTHRLCLLFGNERYGLSNESKQACKQLFTIPIYGMVESYNLSVAAAISLYDVSQRKRQLLKQKGDLNTENKTQQRARYYLNSVNSRLLKNLFNS